MGRSLEKTACSRPFQARLILNDVMPKRSTVSGSSSRSTLGEQLQMERRVDVRVRLEGLDQPGYDVEVGLGVLEVVDQRGHAADRGERGARRGVDLERLVAAEVDVGVDGAGQHVQASGVEPIAALERGPGCVQAGDAAVDDGDVERARVAARRDDSASLDDEIRGHERSLRSR